MVYFQPIFLLLSGFFLFVNAHAEAIDCPSSRRFYDKGNDTCICIVPKIEGNEIKQYVYQLDRMACEDDFWTWWLFTSWPFFVVGTVLCIFAIQLWIKKNKTRRERDSDGISENYPPPPQYSVLYSVPGSDEKNQVKSLQINQDVIPPADQRKMFIKNFYSESQH
uniref:Uncharacterized protein n=1 Tax=Bursaphelenchus xylophilus TaxID=6326 RepID=A0A1I7SDT8_BURXY